ncbi:nucleotidyltransferase [Paenibacillus pasadenensis]|uniref:nucleotidyltransferase n=1 Tax=Paenibacillus pasadenensis TaxID=217090 RepID=UPI002040B8E2|nr:nucleotidyltransferase [Paenibacillus pasadenensis]MCM3746050.1 nucleotidyltransferase [Paenibacillus pasadenensis]
MRSVGLIVEYNPFHNGHAYHLQKSKEAAGADAAVAVMSGHFLQRGEPALMDKWARARTALEGGCDLVLELPLAYSVQPAEWFAYGAVSVLESTGVVDAFCFGSESGELDPLRRAARLLANEPDDFRALLAEKLSEGLPYPTAYSCAVAEYLSRDKAAAQSSENSSFAQSDDHRNEASLTERQLAQPNMTLGLHYLIALERTGGLMEPLTIRREGAGYHDAAGSGSIASATALRRFLEESGSSELLEPFVPSSTLRVLDEQLAAGLAPRRWEDYFQALLHRLLTEPADVLAGTLGFSEGLEHRISAKLPQLPALSFNNLLNALKTKRYTRTRLQRALLGVLLNLRQNDLSREILAAGPGYIRVLGFTGRGRELLARMRKTATVPVLMSAARAPKLPLLDLDVRGTAAYAAACGQQDPRRLLRDYYEPPVQI